MHFILEFKSCQSGYQNQALRAILNVPLVRLQTIPKYLLFVVYHRTNSIFKHSFSTKKLLDGKQIKTVYVIDNTEKKILYKGYNCFGCGITLLIKSQNSEIKDKKLLNKRFVVAF